MALRYFAYTSFNFNSGQKSEILNKLVRRRWLAYVLTKSRTVRATQLRNECG